MPTVAKRSGNIATTGRTIPGACIPVRVPRPPGPTAGSTLPPRTAVGCLRAADGQQLWTVNVIRQFGGRGADFGYACSPLVEDGKVILPVGGRSAAVVALDAENGGKPCGHRADMPASYCSAMPITFHGTRQVVAFLQNDLAGFDLKSGRLLWQQSYSSGYDEHAAFPLYDEPYLRTMRPFRAGSDLYVIEVAPPESNARDESGYRLRLVRHDPQMSNDVASSVLVAGCVYGFDIQGAQTNPQRPSRGMFRCIDFKTGKTLWSSDRPGQATIAVADGKLLLFNDRGELLLVRANPQRYEELARTEVFRRRGVLDGARLASRPAVPPQPNPSVVLISGV